MTGLGHIAHKAHLPCLTRFKDIDLYCCDAWQEPREHAMAEWGIPADHMYSSQTEMIEKVKPDGIYVLIPQYSKFRLNTSSPYEDYVNEVLEAGIPLFVEKPLGVDAVQARRITEKAKSCRVKTTMVGCQRRFHPSLRHAMKLIKENGLLLSANFCFFKGLEADNGDERSIIAHNWLTFDLIHVLDLAVWVPGGNLIGLASAVHKAPDKDSKTCFDALLTFDNNISSHFIGNVRVGGRMLRFELHGSGLSIYISTVAPGGHDMTAWIYRIDPNMKNGHGFLSAPEVVSVRDIAPAPIEQAWAGFWDQACHFIEKAKNGEPTDTSFESALRTIEVCDRIIANG